MGDPVFYGEFRKQLKAAQISVMFGSMLTFPNNIKLKEDGGREKLDGKCGIEINPHSIRLSLGGLSTAWTYILPAGIRALPGTCSGLEMIQGDGIQMRIQLEMPEECEAAESRERMESTGNETGDQILRALTHPDCEVMCARCDAVLISPSGGFQKVLPLPEGDWTDLAGDMWCCKSKVIAEKRGKMASLHLSPDQGTVLVDDLHFIIHSASLRKGSVAMEKKRPGRHRQTSQPLAPKSFCVICQRCKCIVGSIDNQDGSSQLETTKLYRYAVRVSCHSRSNPLEQTFSSLLVTQFKHQMTFKYIVEDDEEHRPRLLVWLLGIDTQLLHSGAPSFNKTLPGSYCSASISVCHDAAQRDAEREVKLESQRVIKVLYQTCQCETGQRLAEEWNRDLMVHGVTLTTDACLELGLILARSTLNAPPAMRHRNGFKVGSLRFEDR
ncbi:E3 ubiquitin-protein ligase E3D-like isoform X1 [Diadema setosum]|uniref:E3 ubiquitin-protein ligase E3D-like isoform X1 n=1 Tax=Diadema setosum TaxID=31175 RepID=UPI003B3A6D10